jgi:hypothetical protein
VPVILSADEKLDLDTLFVLVDDAVVLRNQRVRAERELEHSKCKLDELNRRCELAALRIEKQREKMALVSRSRRGLESVPSRA